MKENNTEQMNASQVFCPNSTCKTCGKTSSVYAGTMFEGLRKPKTLIVIVVTLLAYGCPIQAIVQAFGLDERTVASWRDRAGKHCQQVHQAVVHQGQLDLVQVQADAHPGERAQDDRLDGLGDDGLDAVVGGRRRELNA
jgi:hypothetical protein